MSHSKEINNSNMNDVEEGEISNDKIISPENISVLIIENYIILE